MYGIETVALRMRQEAELKVAEMKMLRFSEGVMMMQGERIVTAPELVTPTAASPQLTLAEPPAEPSSPPPAAARFPAGFSSCPGRRHCRRAAATGRFWVDASYASTEGPPTTASSQMFSPAWVQSRLEMPQSELMRQRVMGFAKYLKIFPEDLDFVHLILESEFLGRGWLDAPASLSAGGPFAPLLEAVSAVARSTEFQPAAAGSTGPQPAAAKSTGPRPAAAGSSEPQPATAGSSEPQPAAAGSLEPQPAAAGSTVPQLAAAESTEPQPAAAGSSEPHCVPEEPV
ncbi:skin secretory protein xP2-like [Girardinichthys multiradiatus]|uniref:skin secretory protein xP2-like n=1 Tax=Girardinichthys multiradiatus TaxID=208333 RepID=UPI001FAD1DB8|nr:skin secretory protein xP2-like [Girardinichthys multiradiatus]